jgi:hypothetical protein
MSQQAAAGQGAGLGGGGRKAGYFSGGGGIKAAKPNKLLITEIAGETFNTGHNKFAAQFTESHKSVANYLQRLSAAEGYLVVETGQDRSKQSNFLRPWTRMCRTRTT